MKLPVYSLPAVAIVFLVFATLALSSCGRVPDRMADDEVNAALLDAGLGERSYFRGDYKDLRQHTFCDSGEDFDPEISPDQKLLLFGSTRNTYTSDIYVKNKNATTFRQVTSHPGNDRFPRFKPGSNSVFVFASDRSGSWDLYLKTDLNTENPIGDSDLTVKRLTALDGDACGPAWSPDGSEIVFQYTNPRTRKYEVWVLTLNSSDTPTFLSKIADGLWPQYSPNSSQRRIVFQRPRGRDTAWFSIWTLTFPTAADSEPVLESLVWDTHWAAINPSYGGGGSMVVFASSHKSPGAVSGARAYHADDIWVIDSSGERLIQITNTPYPEWWPVWAPDGRIYFTTICKGKKNIWSIEPDYVNLTETALK